MTCNGCVTNADAKTLTRKEVNHLPTFSSPNKMPFMIMKNIDTPTIANDRA